MSLRRGLWPGHRIEDLEAEARARLDADDEVCFVVTDESGRIVGFLEDAVHPSASGAAISARAR